MQIPLDYCYKCLLFMKDGENIHFIATKNGLSYYAAILKSIFRTMNVEYLYRGYKYF